MNYSILLRGEKRSGFSVINQHIRIFLLLKSEQQPHLHRTGKEVCACTLWGLFFWFVFIFESTVWLIGRW